MRWIVVAAFVVSLPPALAAQDRQVVFPAGARTAGPYSPGIKAGGLVWASGQIGVTPGTRTLVPGGVGPETRQAMENIGRVLEAAGTSLARVVKCTVFLTDINDFAAMNEVYATFFPVDPPARATVAVSALVAGAHVEIDCIALAG
jgi:2-iminobutanoate/2-iminopropanoate deaminase